MARDDDEDVMQKVRWGVLSTAAIRVNKVIPAMRQAEPADERAGRLLLDGPHAIATQLPMTQEHGQRAPRVRARKQRARADVPHHLGIGAHPRVVVEVGLDELAEFQSFGLECFVHGTPSRLTRTLAPSRGDLPVSAIQG